MSARRAAPAAVALLLVLATVILLTPGDAPATGAAQVVPADALAYLHVSTDPGRSANRRALAVARRLPDFPLLAAGVLQRIGAIVAGGEVPDFRAEVRPWLGDEAALALLDTPSSTAAALIVLDVSDPARARRFLSRHGAVADGRYRGTRLLRYGTGIEAAFVSHYLVMGERSGVQAAVDVARGAPSLDGAGAYRGAADGEPDGRVLDAYVSAGGVRRLLASRSGYVGILGTLLDSPALQGATISVSPTARGAAVRVHRSFDPALARLSRGHALAFDPDLVARLPGATVAALDVHGLDRLVAKLLGAGQTSGLGGQLGALLTRLGATLVAEGIDVHRVVSLFSGQSAIALVGGRRPGSAASPPSLVLVAPVRDEAAARTELAALEAPLAQLFPPPGSGPGRAPVFNDVTVAGVQAHQLALTPGLELDYAVFHGMVVLSSGLGGIAAIARPRGSLTNQSGFRATLGDVPSQVTSLLFLDFSQLLGIGEQTGLTRGAHLQALRPDLQRIRAVALTSSSGEADTTAELSLQIQ